MNKTSLSNLLRYNRFLEKWYNYTKDTAITVFASNHDKALEHFDKIIYMLDKALSLSGDQVSTAKLMVHSEFRAIIEPVVKNHINYVDFNTLTFAMKLFRQSIVDTLYESGVRNARELTLNLCKVLTL